ncbi:hypothetical protein JKP88DRAFT_228975 [Tribonema minus]|uniref:Secreted protein n=1 Tax=Tribonema minus TaxID=303371 RepID=A0A835YKI1_9STRA|nr:hypothetical protein JKP88DRAFT_228975 [Tribonema minus]
MLLSCAAVLVCVSLARPAAATVCPYVAVLPVAPSRTLLSMGGTARKNSRARHRFSDRAALVACVALCGRLAAIAEWLVPLVCESCRAALASSGERGHSQCIL